MRLITPTDKRVEFVELDAEWAQLMLDHPEGRNRKWYPTRIDRYMKIILRGDWKLNGETFKIRKDNSLGDGWHRLQALINADKLIRETDESRLQTQSLTKNQWEMIELVAAARRRLAAEGRQSIYIPALIMWGATDEDIMSVDTGKPRGIHDVLSLEGFRWPPILGAAITLLDTHLHDHWKDSYARTDPEALRAMFEENQGMVDWLDDGDAIFRATKLNRSSSIVGLHLISKSHGNHIRVKDFATKLISGADLPVHHPVLALRDYAIRGGYRVPGQSRLTQKKALTAIIKAFNFAARDKGIKQMRVLYSEEVPEVVRDK